MKAAGGVLTVDEPAMLERLFEDGDRFGEIRFGPGSPAASLAPAINAAYLACGCELARWCALAGLVAVGLFAWLFLPMQGLEPPWRWVAIVVLAMSGFAVAGVLGERIGLQRARLRLRRLADEARRRMEAAPAAPQAL